MSLIIIAPNTQLGQSCHVAQAIGPSLGPYSSSKTLAVLRSSNDINWLNQLTVPGAKASVLN